MQRYFASFFAQIIFTTEVIPLLHEGRFAIVTDVGRDAVDAGGALTKALIGGRRSRVVLTPRRWRQVLKKQASWGRRWQTSPVTGESTKETVKTIARGMPGVSGVTVVTNARAFYTTRAAAGAPSARHSLRPLIFRRRDFLAKLGRIALREWERVFYRPCRARVVMQRISTHTDERFVVPILLRRLR